MFHMTVFLFCLTVYQSEVNSQIFKEYLKNKLSTRVTKNQNPSLCSLVCRTQIFETVKFFQKGSVISRVPKYLIFGFSDIL